MDSEREFSAPGHARTEYRASSKLAQHYLAAGLLATFGSARRPHTLSREGRSGLGSGDRAKPSGAVARTALEIIYAAVAAGRSFSDLIARRMALQYRLWRDLLLPG